VRETSSLAVASSPRTRTFAKAIFIDGVRWMIVIGAGYGECECRATFKF
jgi:hypothetical protein